MREILSVEISKIAEVVEKAKQSMKRNFTQSVDLILTLQDLDLKKPENRISELVELPNPPLEDAKVCVIGTGQLASEAKKAGASKVIEREELEEMGKNKKEARKTVQGYDFFIAEASLMPLIGKTLGSLLGPKGKMPTPVPSNAPIEPIINRQQKLVLLRMKDQPIIQCKIGSEKIDSKKIAENIQTILKRLEVKLERGLKNIYSIQVKTTMGKPILLYRVGMKTK